MTELSIRPEEIRDAIARNVESFAPGTSREEVGHVVETGDGIARVEGLLALGFFDLYFVCVYDLFETPRNINNSPVSSVGHIIFSLIFRRCVFPWSMLKATLCMAVGQ